MPIVNHPLTQRRLQFIGIGVNKLTFKRIDIIQSSNNYNNNPIKSNGIYFSYQMDQYNVIVKVCWLYFYFYSNSIENSRPWSDAAFWGVWSEPALFAYDPQIGW